MKPEGEKLSASALKAKGNSFPVACRSPTGPELTELEDMRKVYLRQCVHVYGQLQGMIFFPPRGLAQL